MTLKSIRNRISRLFRCRRGTSGLEFAIMAPILLGGLVVMTDIGLAFNAKMNLDQSVKSGAQFVMNDVTSETAIEDLMTAAATGSYGDNVTNVSNYDPPTVDAVKTCKCPGSTASVSCDTLCTSGSIPPYIYYTLTASQTYQAMTLPDITLQSQIQVQVR